MPTPKTQERGGQATIKETKCQVTSILEWVQCFSIYIAIIAAKHPERIQDLLGYQALIIEAHMEYDVILGRGMIGASAKQQLHHRRWYGLG